MKLDDYVRVLRATRLQLPLERGLDGIGDSIVRPEWARSVIANPGYGTVSSDYLPDRPNYGRDGFPKREET